ncbi:PREDICTED: putative late blight resistance protein homolog R1A-4 [Ipomoea nil]|uniref:putative late blight resistance protein homolog R1A-4 n=1 Tax=Ipomoea nil TaxID=35883 RepID=UPI000900FBC3|nr:PREDICTED: putative late blight resistance protein homolog R1A-4 [Ipomoea nil]
MAFVALSSLISTIELQFLQPTPRVSLLHHDDLEAPIKSLFESLSSLQTFLQHKSSSNGDGGALRDLEIQIRDFALKFEDDIEIQLSNFLLAKHTEHEEEFEEEASQELRQTLRKADEIAAGLLQIINKEKEHEREREMTCAALTSLRARIDEMEFSMASLRDKVVMESLYENLSSLQAFLVEESSGGATTKDLKTKIIDFAQKAKHIQIQLTNFFQAKHTKSQEKPPCCRELHQALQEATQLLEIITKQKEYHQIARQIALVPLANFMAIFHYYFFQSNPVVFLDDETVIISLYENLSSLQALLQQESSGGAVINDLETVIQNFVFKAEGDIQTVVNNLLGAEDTEEYQEKASQLNQTLQEAAENVAELLMIINSEKESDAEIQMALVALSSLMGTIEQGFLDDEAVTKSFCDKISSLQAFLQKESSGGGAVKDLETEIKDFALKAGNDIAIQLNNFLQAKDTEYEEKVTQELHHTTHEAAESAAELLNIINEVDEAYETQPTNTWLKHAASKSVNVESDESSHGFLKPEGRMVGRRHDCRVIKDQLFSPSELNIISIVGMVGIGKTTVARNVYEDPSVASHFDVRAWVTIPPPQHYNKSRMLSDLLQSITPAGPIEMEKGSTPDELEMQVRECLRGRRYLIVLDNTLSNQAYIDIRECIPEVEVGSCILLTTSIRDFIQYNYSYNYIHNMTLLDPKESWELFCNILSIEEHLAPKFEKIRNHVVEKCDGLPQLIVEVAKRLSGCNNIQQQWKKIEKELESLGLLDRNALLVNYNSLPHHLKVCFLYFGVFPKRNKVLVKMLIRLWIAEGFVKPLEHKELEDQAYEYLEELIDRSLLLIEDQSFEGKIKTCRMHSALHSFCVGEAQREGILCTINTQQHPRLPLKEFANSCRWLSFYSHSFDYYVLFGTNIPRSIFFFHKNPKMFVPLKLLRVLAFDTSMSLQRVPMQLRDLVFLRYLSITQWFDDLNDVVSNNPNLQTLVVSSNGAPIVHLPSNIWEAPPLRHLELGNSYMLDPPSMVKENLQSLSCVMRPIHCRKKVYDQMPNIKKLKIFLNGDIGPSHTRGSCSNPIILDNFDHLKGLEKLGISVSIGCNAALPEQCMYPSGLKKLKLSGTNISVRDLNVIAMLPQLMVLKLENSFHGTVWEVADGGFLQLIFLLLEAKELEQWVVSWNPFPMLRHLVLRSCNCLEQMPKKFLGYKLESIELEGCHSSLVASAKQFQKERRLKNLKIKILDRKYDESQKTHT